MLLMAKIMNAWPFSWSAERWLSIFEVVSVGAGVLTAAALIGIAVSSKTVSAQRKVEFDQLKIDLTNAKLSLEEQREKTEQQREKVARTELRLEEVRKAQAPRRISGAAFVETLKGKQPASKVTVLYLPNDGEAYNFAWDVWRHLFRAGWNPSQPAPIPSDIVTDMGQPKGEVVPDLPATMRAGGQPTGVSIVGHKIDPMALNDPMNVLTDAFLAAGMSQVSGGPDRGMEEGELRIVIGAKP